MPASNPQPCLARAPPCTAPPTRAPSLSRPRCRFGNPSMLMRRAGAGSQLPALSRPILGPPRPSDPAVRTTPLTLSASRAESQPRAPGERARVTLLLPLLPCTPPPCASLPPVPTPYASLLNGFCTSHATLFLLGRAPRRPGPRPPNPIPSLVPSGPAPPRRWNLHIELRCLPVCL